MRPGVYASFCSCLVESCPRIVITSAYISHPVTVLQYKQRADKRLKAGIQRSVASGAMTIHNILCTNGASWLVYLCAMPGSDGREQLDITVDVDQATVTLKCPNVPQIPVCIASMLGQVKAQRQLGAAKKNLLHTFRIALPSEGLCFWPSLRYTLAANALWVAVKLRAAASSGQLKFSTTTSKWTTTGGGVAAALGSEEEDDALPGLAFHC
jgi:hypothetical protein